MDALFFGLISFCTSSITAVIGIGGGLLLLAILPSFLPANVLIPIHSLNQITSNVSRAYFGYKEIQFQVIPKFFIGSLFGVGLFSYSLNYISMTYIPVFIGTYILLSLWSQTFNTTMMHYENYYLIGFFQTGLSVIVGTTGQLAIAKLLKDFHDKDKVIATSAVLMCITHVMKITVFVYFGFVFREYLGIILTMTIGSVFGSYVGTSLRHRIDGKKLVLALKIVLTALAIKSIMQVLVACAF